MADSFYIAGMSYEYRMWHPWRRRCKETGEEQFNAEMREELVKSITPEVRKTVLAKTDHEHNWKPVSGIEDENPDS